LIKIGLIKIVCASVTAHIVMELTCENGSTETR
jgi:hypothetical protein